MVMSKATRQVTRQEIEQDFAEELNRDISRKQKELAEWAEKFHKDPLYQLSWGLGVFETAAELKVLQTIQDFIEEGFSIEYTFGEIQSRAHYAATQMHQSTSPTSNLAAEYERVSLNKAVAHGSWHVLSSAANRLRKL
jgi:hypothetical protein